VRTWSERLGVVSAGHAAPISTLSGGNQQKVILARCLALDPQVLVLCEPTAGVDIGTRVSIYQIIADLAATGLTVIVASSDEGDLLALCTRILVLRDGVVAEELAADGLTKSVLIRAIEGAEK
jgi:ribose transport system ATP-binding protein